MVLVGNTFYIEALRDRSILTEIAEIMRVADRNECELMHGSVTEALTYSVRFSQKTLIIRDKQKRICGIYGYSFGGDGVMQPWFLSTVHFPSISIQFTIWAKQQISELKRFNRPLLGFVAVKYETAIRWLEYIGIHVDKTQNIHEFFKFTD